MTEQPFESLQDSASVICPYCGTSLEVYIDYSGGVEQSYIEDCQICCRPIEFQIHLSEKYPDIRVNRIE